MKSRRNLKNRKRQRESKPSKIVDVDQNGRIRDKPKAKSIAIAVVRCAVLLALFLSTASGQEVGPGERLRQIEIEKALQNERFERAREMGEGAKLRFQQLLTEENELKAKLGPGKTETPAKTK